MIRPIQFLYSIRQFLYYSLYIILFMVFMIAILSNNILQWVVFYLGLVIANLIRHIFTFTKIGSVTKASSSNPSTVPTQMNNVLYNSYPLYLGFSNTDTQALPLFVWAYTMAYVSYPTIMIKKITLPHMYFMMFILFYFICHTAYILLFIYTNIMSQIPSIIYNIILGFALGIFIAYLIDRFINYKLLLFSTYKTQTTTLKCST